MKTVCVLGVAGMLVAGAAPARAQGQAYLEHPIFVNVGVGAQPQRHTLNATQTFTIYDEPATITSLQRIRNGALFEVNGGYHLSPSFAVGAGFSTFGRPGTGTLTASIPHPIFYNQPARVSQEADDLAHSERAFHVQALYFAPVSDRIDIALSAGPSFIHVKQQIVGGTVPTGTQSLATGTVSETGTAKGFNVGFQGNYMLAPNYGVGLFLGYAGGKVDLPSAADVKVGGVRTGLAFQARF